MCTNLMYMLIGPLTAVALFTLPVAQAYAGNNWR